MDVTALLMAGGRGKRLRAKEEKPLLKVGSKPMIEYVLNALHGVKRIDRIIVAVSSHTPKTAAYVKRYPVDVFITPGRGWCLDMRYAIKKLQLHTVLTIAADLPLITCRIIEKVIESYDQCGKPALTVMVPLETIRRLGLTVDYVLKVRGKSLVPAGINIINGKRAEKEDRLEEEILVIDDERIAVNVNTLEDLKVAERMLQLRSR